MGKSLCCINKTANTCLPLPLQTQMAFVSAGRQYRSLHIIFFITLLWYWQATDTRAVSSSNSFKVVSAARQYNWNSQRLICRLTFYRGIALRCRRIQTCRPCFFFFYRRIDPSYRRPVSAPPFFHSDVDFLLSNLSIAPTSR